MSLQALIPIVLKVSIWLSVLALGLQAGTRDVTYMLRRPAELARALLAMNLLLPLFAVALVSTFALDPAIKIALVMLSVSPIPPLLPNKVTKAGGAGSYAVGLLVAVSVLSIVLVPLAMKILDQVFRVGLRMSAASIARLIFLTVLLPIALGIVLNRFAPGSAERLAKRISRVAGIALLACVLAIVFAAAPAIGSLVGDGTVLAIASFVLVGIAIGHLLGGPERDHRAALAIATASRHPGIAVALVVANFPEQKLALAAVLLYLLVSAVVLLPYLSWIKRTSASQPPGKMA